MMNFRTLPIAALLLAAALVVGGCGQPNVREQQSTSATEQPLSVFEHYERGVEYYSRWEQDQDLPALQLARYHFAYSLTLQPDNVNIQHAHYETLTYASLYADKYSEKTLVQAFEALNPMIRRQVVAPAKVTYARLNDKQTDPQLLIPVLQRAIRQQPGDAHTWKLLSETYESAEYDWMAIAAAHKAVEQDSESLENLFQLGYALNTLLESRACQFDQQPLIQRSANYLTRAAALDKDNEGLAGMVGLQYLRMGLYPLALKFTRQAWDAEQDAWNASSLIDVLINMRRYDEAAAIASQSLDSELGYDEPYRDLALHAASRGDWRSARDQYFLQLQARPNDLYYRLIFNWIDSLAEGHPQPINLTGAQPASEWELRLQNYFTDDGLPGSYLLDNASDTCMRADAHFYTAMRAWRNGDLRGFHRHLEATREQKATWFQEHFWADILLRM